MKRYKVGTYYAPEMKHHGLAYLHPWLCHDPGCVVIEVEARDGPEAKRKALRERVKRETGEARQGEGRRACRAIGNPATPRSRPSYFRGGTDGQG